MIPLAGWVAPFGDPGITDRSHLPRAFRSVPRPSSPLSAKASTRCPSFALERHTQRQKSSRDPRLHSQPRWSNDAPAQAGAHHGPAFLSPGGTCKVPPPEDTIGIPHAQASRPVRRMDPASVTQLAYSHLSINNPPPTVKGPAEGKNFFMPRIGSGGAPAGLSAKPAVSPVALGRTAFGRWWRCPVEVNGIEPMTSCLQSRRSPS